MKKGCSIIIVILVLVVFGGYTYAKNWYNNAIYDENTDQEGETIEYTVEKGTNFIAVVEDLIELGFDTEKLAVQMYLRSEGISPNIKVGEYEIAANINIPALITILEQGVFEPGVRVTIAEGYRLDENAENIAGQLDNDEYSIQDYINIAENPDQHEFSAEVAEFLNIIKPTGKSLEGLLYPETYEFKKDTDAKGIIERQILTLKAQLEEYNIDINNPTTRLSSLYEVITLASIVEREATTVEDRKIVADIFLKRLEQNISLGSDVTLLYPLKRWNPEPTAAELKLDTPYNTRTYFGLTPTPINNPGIEAIDAIVNPTPNEYIFFIADVDSMMRYGKTLFEHNQNIQRYGLVK